MCCSRRLILAVFMLMLWSQTAVATEVVEMPLNPPRDQWLDKLTFVPKFSYQFFMQQENTTLTVPMRHGAQLQYDIDVGDQGYVGEFAPYFSVQWPDSGDVLLGGGLVFDLVYRFDFEGIAPSFGVGMRLGYVHADDLGHGLDIYGRFPVACTFYLSPDFAIHLEIGVLYGITGFWIADASGNGDKEIHFVDGFGVDAGIGFRFP